jgi:C-terminal processing protease CtpA/Prc
MLHMRRLWLLGVFVLLAIAPVFAIGEPDRDDDDSSSTTDTNITAMVVNDEGGAVSITGTVSYTNPFFTSGVSQPLVILEDQAGFVDRNEYFLFPPESQVLGQITSDFLQSPFSYSLALPQEPQGSLRDVDNDGETDAGVMVFAVAYWSNTFGDPYLEERDQYGGGWSTAYASTVVSINPETAREIIGGKFVIYASEDGQGFPSGFGEDGLLFTEDDPIVTIPQGWSVVNLDAEPFTFDRSRNQTIELFEPEGAAVVDYSSQGYVEAFNNMVDLLSNEYAFTEYYGLNWEDMRSRYLPRFEEAASNNAPTDYALALRDFLWEIPDGHVSMSLDLLLPLFREDTDGGFGFAIRELDDGRVLTNFVLPNSPAAEAGITLGTEIIARDGVPIEDVLADTFVWAHQALGTEHTKRLQQLRYATRSPLGADVAWTFINDDGEEETATMTAIPERDSFSFSSFNANRPPTELPVEYEILPSGYGYVAITSFSDDEYLTVQLWERMIAEFTANNVAGIIVDMRRNGGGSGFLADQMAAYFFDEPLELGNTGAYNEELGEFYFDERGIDRFYLPPEEKRWLGPVAVLVEPSCWSACEFFSYNLTLQDRAEIIGFYPTGGLGGSVNDFYMPENVTIRFTAGRAVDPNGEIHIEGKGVAPTVDVPVNEETLFAEDDVLLRTAEQTLTNIVRGEIIEGGMLAFAQPSGTLSASKTITGEQVAHFEVELLADTIVSFYAGSDDDTLDTTLAIYDASGTTLLAENDDANDSTVSSALEGLTVTSPLTVIVEVGLFDAEAQGEFTLTIESAPSE